MDNPNITMEEYIRLEEEKDRRRGKVYNWETAKYGKIWYDEDIHDLRSVKTEFPTIVFNDELSSEKTLSCEPTVSSLNKNEIDFRISFDESDDEDYTVIFDKNSFSYKIISVNDLKNETSLSEYDEVEQNVLYFNDLFSFNMIHPDDLKSDKDSDDNKIDIIQSSRGNVNTQGQKKFLEASHDKINKIFNVESFIVELKVNIVTWNYLVNGMLLNLIKNLYVPFGIPFDPKRAIRHMALQPRDLKHQYLRYEGLQYTDADIADFETRFGEAVLDLDTVGALLFQLGGVRRRMSWREFILAMGIHTAEEIESVRFGAYWAESARQIPDKGDLSAYWVGISSTRNFLGTPPSYTLIRDLMLRLCHRLVAYSIAGRSQALEKMTVTDLFYLRGVDAGLVNVPYLLARLQICLNLDDTWAWIASGLERQQVVTACSPKAAEDAPVVDEGAPTVLAPVQAPQPPPPAAGPSRTMTQRLAKVEEDVHEIRGALGEHREAGVRYTSYADFQIPCVRRTRRRTDDASTFTAQQDEQLDP
ncbi:hypothetical protein Tco_0066106 [Tanacetum coccineum]